MKLQEIYDQLQYGELTQHIIGENGLQRADYPKLFQHVKLALTVLHTRFVLREVTTLIPLVDNQLEYVVTPDANDLLTIERVYGTFQESEHEIPLDSIDDVRSIRKPEYNKLVIPSDLEYDSWLDETSALKVVYRADHTEIDTAIAELAPSVVDITLPPAFMNAVLLFIASRIFNPVGMSSEFHQGNNYAAKFEAEVQRLQAQNVSVDTESIPSQFEQQGWP